MKNVHILPTDKPSRLYLHSNNELQLRTNIIRTSEDYLGTNQNIYITSDEEIKDCWVLNSHINEVYFLKGYYGIQPLAKKIILTTDQDLIKDGVQSIDDEFLEWFVKNPSCEKVEVRKVKQIPDGITYGMFGNDEPPTEMNYKIIIPKEELSPFDLKESPITDNEFYQSLEEPKQEPCDNCNNDVCCCIIRKQETLEEPKKLTVEEALLLVRNAPMTFVPNKRMYTEEDMEEAFENGLKRSFDSDFDRWFEQFKKK